MMWVGQRDESELDDDVDEDSAITQTPGKSFSVTCILQFAPEHSLIIIQQNLIHLYERLCCC